MQREGERGNRAEYRSQSWVENTNPRHLLRGGQLANVGRIIQNDRINMTVSSKIGNKILIVKFSCCPDGK